MKTLTISWTERHPDVQTVVVVHETEKALFVQNTYNGRQAWIPRTGLRAYQPPKICPRSVGDDEFTVADWFRARCSHNQMAALGFAE